MNLSRVFRSSESDELKQFSFRSFGDTDPVAPLGVELSGGIERPEARGADPAAELEPPQNIQQLLEEAHARGREEGTAMAAQRFENATQSLTQALEEVCRLRESLAMTASQDMLRLVMAVAEQIIRRTVEVRPEVVVKIVEHALHSSVRADSYRVRINPADLEAITAQKPLFLASISGLKNLSIEADDEISRGGCRVDSELGDVDATIESQLETIRASLAEAITEG